VKLLIIEDQTMARGFVVNLCRAQLACERIEEAATGVAGVAVCREMQPDVVLLDVDLPDASGLDLVEKLNAEAPEAKIVILSSHTEDYVLHRVLQAQVDGFVDKNDEPADAIVEAVEAVMDGRTYFSAAMTRMKSQLRKDPVAFTKLLTGHEQNLLGLFGQGLSNEQIGVQLGLSHRTIGNHRQNIMDKLGISTTPELMRYAVKKGFTRWRAAGP